MSEYLRGDLAELNQPQRLFEYQRRHHQLLWSSGLALKLITLQDEKHQRGETPWPGGHVGDTKFSISRGGDGSSPIDVIGRRVLGAGKSSMSFSVKKAESDISYVSLKVFSVRFDRAENKQTLRLEEGINLEEAKLVYGLFLELALARERGELSGLTWGLQTVTELQSSWEDDTVVNFGIDPAVFERDSQSN